MNLNIFLFTKDEHFFSSFTNRSEKLRVITILLREDFPMSEAYGLNAEADRINQRKRKGGDFRKYFFDVQQQLPELFKAHSIPSSFDFTKNETPWGPTCSFSISPEVASRFNIKILKISSDCPHLVYPLVGQALSTRDDFPTKTQCEIDKEIKKIFQGELFSFFRRRFPGIVTDVHCFSMSPPLSKKIGLSLYHLQSVCPVLALKILKQTIPAKKDC